MTCGGPPETKDKRNADNGCCAVKTRPRKDGSARKISPASARRSLAACHRLGVSADKVHNLLSRSAGLKDFRHPGFLERGDVLVRNDPSDDQQHIIEAVLAPHLDPVEGKEQDVKIQLPNGFIWKWADACKSTVMNILTPHLNFNHAGQNAFYSVVEYAGP